MTCEGCGGEKQLGLVVCWECFNRRKDVTPLGDFEGSYTEWLATLPQRKTLQ